MTNRPDGTSAASFVNVDEGLEIPVSAITQAGSSVTLEVKSIGGSYTGSVNGAGTELAGTFSQGTGSVPLTFRAVAPSQGTPFGVPDKKGLDRLQPFPELRRDY